MSAELPNVSNTHVNNRLQQLERRLEQAKEARNNYIEFLKQNRAQGDIQNEPIQGGQELQNPRPSLMRRLETGQYFWNFQSQPESYSYTPLPTNEPVPRGMVLNTDMNAMTKRLNEIGASIRNMRDYRLSLPSDEYFRSARPHLQNSPNFSNFYGDPNKADLSSLAEIRSRILNMQMNVEKRTRELLDQRRNPRSIVQSAVPIIERTKPPDWIHQKELEEELKRLSTSNIEKRLGEKPIQQNESLITEPPKVPTMTKEPKIEDKPAVISSNRQIIFELNNPTKTVEAEPSKPEPTKEYNRMLDILRPKQVEISSSDESEAPLRQVASGQSGSMSGTKVEAIPPPKPLPSFLQTQPTSLFSSTPTQKPSLSQALAKPKLDDSDSDFFK